METLTKPRFTFDPVKHYYELDGSPLIGTTTALGVLSKELTWWASGMACAEFGWINPKKNKKEACIEAARKGRENIEKLDFNGYMELLNKAYRAHNQRKNDTAETGKDMHSLLEEFIRFRMMGHEPFMINPIIKDFVAWSDKNVKRFLFTEMCCFSQVLHCGGTADFGYENMAGENVLGDFKSSEKPYFGHWAQCGAYDLQITENGGYTALGEKMFNLDKPFSEYAIFCFRGGLDKPFFKRDLALPKLKKAFSYAINLYREKMFFEED